MADENDPGNATDSDLGDFIDSDSTGDSESDSTGTGSHDRESAGPDSGEAAHSNSDSGGTADSDPGESSDSDPVEVGVELLSKLEHPELTVAEAVDRIETVTTHPATTRKILDEAEKRGVIEREDGIVETTGGGYVSFESEVVTKEGEFSCRRCGASISEGYFIELDAGEHGAFGPECIRKVTGRG